MRLVLDPRLYSPSAVKKAAASFSEFARFKIESSRSSITVTIEDISSDVSDVLADEFLNFALAATIEARG